MYSNIKFYVYIFCLGDIVAEIDVMQLAPKFSSKRQSNIEKQITLEVNIWDFSSTENQMINRYKFFKDQAICGALQTLNEEALEDVLDEREADMLSSADLVAAMQGYNSSNISTCSDANETDVLYLQT